MKDDFAMRAARLIASDVSGGISDCFNKPENTKYVAQLAKLFAYTIRKEYERDVREAQEPSEAQ